MSPGQNSVRGRLGLGGPGQSLGAAMRQRPLLAWTAVIGLALLAWLLFGEPLLQGLDALERETTALRQAWPARAAALAREKARLDVAQAQARQALALAPQLAPLDQERLQAEVNRLAQEQGLSVTSLTPRPVSAHQAYQRQVCSLQAQGDFRAVTGFLQALAQTPGLLHPLSLELARAPGSPVLNLDIQVAGLAGK